MKIHFNAAMPVMHKHHHIKKPHKVAKHKIPAPQVPKVQKKIANVVPAVKKGNKHFKALKANAKVNQVAKKVVIKQPPIKKHLNLAPVVNHPIPVAIPQASSAIQALEKKASDDMNAYRQTKGLKPLTFSQALYDQAAAHSQNMAAGTVPFSHEGFDKRFQAVKTQVKIKSFAENVAFNQNAKSPVTTAVNGLIASPGHHKNIVGDFNLTAIAVAKGSSGKYYFTQLFAKA